MKPKVEKSYTIELPSDPNVVTVNNIWKILFLIPKIGRVFQKEDIIKSEKSPLKHPLSVARVLSYLKYLKILEEERKPKQKFKIKKNDDINSLYYFLQCERDSDARIVWKKILSNHDLFLFLRDKLLTKQGNPTIVELQDELQKIKTGVRAEYLKRGALFIAKLLDDAGLIRFDEPKGMIYKLEEKPSEEKLLPKEIIPELEEEIDREDKRLFPLRITAKTDKFEFDIQNETDWEIVEAIVKSLKTKWEESKVNKPKDNDKPS